MPLGFLGILPAIVPLVDLLNHCASPNVRIKSAEDTGDARLVITQAVKTGDELCVTYGESSVRSYLLQYGFLDAYQPVALTMSCPLPTAEPAQAALAQFHKFMDME